MDKENMREELKQLQNNQPAHFQIKDTIYGPVAVRTKESLAWERQVKATGGRVRYDKTIIRKQ